jgi:hypothetical protein
MVIKTQILLPLSFMWNTMEISVKYTQFFSD